MKKEGDTLEHLVNCISKKSADFLELADKYQAPFYVYDEETLDESINNFVNAFQAKINKFETCYALKLNHHPFIVNRVVEKGLGLDVASKRELSMALETEASKIVYYSPGKTEDDLKFALQHSDRVRIHVDSFSELHNLGKVSTELDKEVEIGVRVHFPDQGDWKKYGIPLSDLQSFWQEASGYKKVNLNGVHFHQSRNRSHKFYTKSIKLLSEYLRTYFSKEDLSEIEYVDFGGGYEPYLGEGEVIRNGGDWPSYSITETATIEEYAEAIGDSIGMYLEPLIDATYISEPGRYICNGAMHIMLQVADIKDSKNVILNGGVNMVGWQRFEFEYFPLINISQKDTVEHDVSMWGNLCTTWDIWGYHYFGQDLKVGDYIVVPNQGALTYSLAQSFINKIPEVYKL
jgi:diaminopimelate decarboxylase